jgi:carbamoyltransferase
LIILGINNMHDAAAAIVVDGRVVAAVEEERFTRRKHQSGFPVNAIRYCLKAAGITMQDLDVVGIAWKPWVLQTRFLNALKALPVSTKAFRAKAQRGVGQLSREWAQLFAMRRLIERRFGQGRFILRYVEHHLCHAVSAFYVAPYQRAAILTVDGAGEKDATVFWIGEDTKITKLQAIRLPHSLGQFYAAITGFLGFQMQTDEYKVMGMAAYGEPSFAELFRKEAIRLDEDGTFRLNPYFIDYHLARQGSFLDHTIHRLGKNRLPDEAVTQRHMDIAKSAQVVLEEALFHVVNHLYKKTGLDKLCLAGGVAFNCVANGKLLVHTPFRHIFVQPAAGDAGTALGAALFLYHRHSASPREYIMEHAYLGPGFSNGECKAALESFGLDYRELTDQALCQQMAKALADGKLVCWFQGRMEWGPRALGNRSLLADPRRKEMRDLINRKVKQREPFRPFAPSLLEERSGEYLVDAVPSPFMLLAFDVRPAMRRVIPAVTHVDGTTRPQTVSRETNPLFWRLIKEFEALTRIPVLLNTSFNVQEPVVCTPRDAIDCFLRTTVDHLVLNNLLVERTAIEQ